VALNRSIAYIDLDTDRIDHFPIPAEWHRRFIGGWGISVYLLCRDQPGRCDAGHGKNRVVISAGLLGGTLSNPKGPLLLTAKSPVTGLMGSIAVDGAFAAQMRLAGWDHLVISGTSGCPATLHISTGQIRILPGLNQDGDGSARILQFVKTKAQGIKIMDPAFREAASTDPAGIGSVLAGKNIDAVSCRGNADIQIKDPKGVIEFEKQYLRRNKIPKPSRQNGDDTLYKGMVGTVSRLHLERVVARCLGYAIEDATQINGPFIEDACQRLALNTGLVWDRQTLLSAAFRCITLERLFNIREGILLEKKVQIESSADEGGFDDPIPDTESYRRSIAALYRKQGWTRAAVMKKAAVFDAMEIGELWPMFRNT